MTRKEALNIIRYEYATHGVSTDKAVRVYCENSISHVEYQEAIRQGIEIYKSKHNRR